MAKIDKANRFVFSIQVLALLVSVCFASSLSPLSGNRPRLTRSSSGCTLTLYDGDIGSSPLELTTTDSSLVNDDWNDRASSAVVSGSCQWILYGTDFEENSTISSVVGPGNYPFNFSSNETTFGLPDNVLSAVRCLPPEGMPAIVLFEHDQYFGQMQVINSSNSNLARINFDNMVSSLVITGGVWELYSEANYTGSNVTRGQGLYPDVDNLAPIENDDLTSVRLTVTSGCNADTTEFLSWPETLAGTTQTLQCPDTTTMVNRTCSLSGMWESVDLSPCTLASINATVMSLVTTLRHLRNRNGDQLQENASNIARTFETTVSVLAQQLDDRQRYLFVTENFVFLAELLPQAELAATGRSFSSSGETGNINISTLRENTTAATYLPASLFQSIANRTSVGVVYAVYDSGVLFPIANATEQVPGTNAFITTVVSSPILGTIVGSEQNFSNLTEPVRVLLQLQKKENVTSQPRCVSWDFNFTEWTTDGCMTDLAEVNEGLVTCYCNHLTNFAVLVDICSRFREDCMPSPQLQTALQTLTIVGVALSLIGIVLTVFTLLFFKKFRKRDVTIFHVQLCIALFCMLIIFVCGINRTAIYGVCVAVSALIHYFTLVSVMFMGAEAAVMFQKLVLVFGSTSTKFFVTVSLICWPARLNLGVAWGRGYVTVSHLLWDHYNCQIENESIEKSGGSKNVLMLEEIRILLSSVVPIIPVVIPMAVDLSDAVSGDLVVRLPTPQSQGFCFISDTAVFFGAFLGPIFAILIVNVVIFVLVIGAIIRHTRNKLDRINEKMNLKIAIILFITIAGIMFLFGLTWLFGALTVTGIRDTKASTAFQVLFVICNAFQGFFIFFFLCVFNKDARDLWLELLSCGRYQSKSLRSSQAKYMRAGGNVTLQKIKTTSGDLTNSAKSGTNLSIDDLSKEDTPLTLTSAANQGKEMVMSLEGDNEIHVGADQNDSLESSEVKENEQVLETSKNSEEQAFSGTSEVNKEDLETAVIFGNQNTI